MASDIVLNIIRLCKRLDSGAVRIYRELAKVAKSEDLVRFWDRMSAEEAEHVEFWKKLTTLARDGAIPQVFDRPFDVVKELETICQSVDGLLGDAPAMSDTPESLTTALQLEFYLLHPAFETLFHQAKFLELSAELANAEREYDSHISLFFKQVDKHAGDSRELKLIASMLVKLWQRNRELAEQSSSDPVTGSLNRQGFLNAVYPIAHLSERNGYHLGVLFLDIDDFKKVNDAYGHRTGDEVLAGIANMIRDGLRRSDIVGRWGGEEFVALLSRVEPGYVAQIAEKIRATIAETPIAGIKVTASIGATDAIVRVPVADNLQGLIDRADQCMYVSKRAGKNRVTVKRSDDAPTIQLEDL